MALEICAEADEKRNIVRYRSTLSSSLPYNTSIVHKINMSKLERHIVIVRKYIMIVHYG